MTESNPIHAGANGDCPDYGSTLDPCPPGCASGTCVAVGRGYERKQNERHLAALIKGIADEWLNYVEWRDDTQVKVIPQTAGTYRVVADAGRGDQIGEFAVTITVHQLPPPDLQREQQQREQIERDYAKQREILREKIWWLRTWADVRTGDTVRLPGTENVAHVDSAVHLAWNVDSTAGLDAQYRPDEYRLDWQCVRVSLAGAGEWDMDPAKPIEIQLDHAEVDALKVLADMFESDKDVTRAQAIDAVWKNRVGLVVQHGGA